MPADALRWEFNSRNDVGTLYVDDTRFAVMERPSLGRYWLARTVIGPHFFTPYTYLSQDKRKAELEEWAHKWVERGRPDWE